MSLTRKQFEKGEFNKGKSKKTIEDSETVKFLRKNHNRAYRSSEISKHTGVSHNTVRSSLSRAKRKGLIESKSPYFIWKKSKKK